MTLIKYLGGLLLAFLQLFPRGTYIAFYKGKCTLGGKKQTDFPGSIGSELTLTPGGSRKHCGPTVNAGAYGGK